MSYFLCPNCKEQHKIFGESHIDNIASEHNIASVSKLPMDIKLAAGCDSGLVELYDGDWLDALTDIIEGKA